MSTSKLQYVELEVKYLGQIFNFQIMPSWIEGILTQLLPINKKGLRKFLGLTEYCRLWIKDYALKTKGLYLKLIETEPHKLQWMEEEKKLFENLKLELEHMPVLRLPNIKKPFHLFVNVINGIAWGVLAQM